MHSGCIGESRLGNIEIQTLWGYSCKMNVVIFLAYDVILLKGYHPVDKTMVYGFVYHREAPGLLSDFII